MPTPEEIYNKLLGDQSNGSAANYDRVVVASTNKLTELAQASKRKREALAAFDRTMEARNTLGSSVASLGTDSDIAREASKGLASGSGLAVGGSGRFLDEVTAALMNWTPGAKQLNAYLAEQFPSQANQTIGRQAQKVESTLQGVADSISQQQHAEHKIAMENSQFGGDIFDPATWTAENFFGKDPSLQGVLGHTANMFGQLTPQLLSALLTKNMGAATTTATGAAIGGAQAGEAAANDAESFIDGLSEEDLSQTGLYTDLRKENPNLTHEQAKAEVKKQAAKAAFIGGGAVGALGGAATNYILGPLAKKLQGTLASRLGATVGLESVSEGVEETSEDILAKAATNLVAGTDRNITEGSFGNFAMGALGGGSIAGAAHVVNETERGLQNLREASSPIAEKLQEQKKAIVEDSPAIKKAVETGDVSEILDMPGEAAKALYINIRKEDRTPEQKEGYRKQLDTIAAVISDEVGSMEEKLKELQDDPSKEKVKKQFEKRVATRKQALDTVLQFQEKLIRQEIDSKTQTKTPPDTTQEDQETPVQGKVQNTDVSFANVIEDVNQGVEGSVDNVITLTMTDPEVFTDEALTQVSKSKVTTPEQKQYLNRFVTARKNANEALKTMGEVSNDIANGADGYKGLSEYTQLVTSAIHRGDIEAANKTLTKLGDFAANRQNKAQVIQEAITKARALYKSDPAASKRGFQVISVDGEWVLNEKNDLSPAELKAYNGLRVHPGSTPLANSIDADAKFLAATHERLKAGLDIRSIQNTPTQPKETVSNPEPVAPAATKQVGQPTDAPNTEAVTSQPVTESTVATTAANPVNPNEVQVDETTSPAQPEERVEAAESTPVSKTETDTQRDRAPEPTVQESVQTTPDIDTVEQVETVTTPEEQVQEEAELTTQEAKQQERTKPYREKDILKAFFTRKKGRAGDKSPSILTQEEDLISKLEWTPGLFKKYLGNTLNAKQQRMFQYFFATAQEWQPVAKSVIGEKERAYWYKDPIQFLQDKDGKFPDNLFTAMAFAAFNYVTENAKENPRNDDETINRILGRDDDHLVSLKERQELALAGTNEKLVIQSLGKTVAKALGYSPDKDAPLNEIARLEGSLGTHVLAMMMKLGIMERVDVDPSIFKNEHTKNEKATHPFTRFKRAGETLPKVTEEISNIASGTGGALTKLFHVEPGRTFPTFEPVEFIQKTVKGARSKISELQQQILSKENTREHRFRLPMIQLFEALPDEVINEFAGIVDVENLPTHKANVESIKARNGNHVRDLNYLREMLETMRNEGKDLTSPFYFGRSVWKIFRVGLASNTVNPQTSKIHRHMIEMDGWETKVNLNNLKAFRLAVADAFGISTDKQLNKQSLKEVIALIKSDEVKKAVAATKKAITGQVITEEDAQAIRNVRPAGKRSFHALEGLMALAQMELAKDQGQTSFKTTLMREVDGVNNGPILGMLQLGDAHNAAELATRMEKGGFYQTKSGKTFYTEWRETSGNEDLYQSIARAIDTQARTVYTQDVAKRKSLAAAFRLIGNFIKDGEVTSAGRGAVKTPLTGFMFGSSVSKAVSSMAGEAIDGYYSTIEDIALTLKQDGDVEAAQKNLSIVVGAMNDLISEGRFTTKVPLLNPNMTVEQALNTVLTQQQQDAAILAFNGSFGKVVTDVFDTRFAQLKRTRNLLNGAADIAFQIYNAAYQAARKQYISTLVKQGELPLNTDKLPVVDLTAKQEQEVRERVKALEPYVHTYYSKQSGDLTAGYHMLKQDRGNIGLSTGEETELKSLERQLKDPNVANRAQLELRAQELRNIKGRGLAYTTESKLGTRIPKNNEKDETLSYMSSRALVPVDNGPGVATIIGLLHSTDSAISALAYEKLAALNIHDAHGYGINNIEKGAKNLNEATYEIMRDYSIPLEIADSLGRSIQSFVDFYTANPELQDELKTAYNKLRKTVSKDNSKLFESASVKGPDAIKNYLQVVRGTAVQVTQRKLEVLKDTAYVNQYGLEGGSYEVTTADQAKTQEALDAVNTVNAAQKPTQETNTVTETVWGELGEPNVAPDLELARRLKAEGTLPARKVMGLLEQHLRLKQKGRILAFNLTLLKELKKVVNPATMVNYITPDTPVSPTGKDVTKARGWYSISEDGNSINIKSTDFKHSGVTPETLLHELVHAAVAQTIQDTKKGSRAAYLVQELEQLRKLAKEKIDTDPSLTHLTNAVENTHELVAWGMTSEEFQRKVLNEIQYESKSFKNRLVTGMKAFLNVIIGIVYRGSDKSRREQAETGLAVLIVNTAGLFKETELRQKLKEKEKIRSLNQQTQTSVQETVEQTEPAQGSDVTTLLQEDAVSSAAYTSSQVLDALIKQGEITNPDYKEHLQDVMKNVVNKVHGPFGAYAVLAQRNAPLTVADTFVKSLHEGTTPFVSEALGKVKLSNAEAYVLQQVEMTMQAAFDSSHVSYMALNKLFKEAKEAIPVESFYGSTTPTSDEVRKAKELHSFIFDIRGTGKARTDHLSRFVAMALVYPPLYNKLSMLTTKVSGIPNTSVSLAQRIKNLFYRVLNAISYALPSVYAGQQANHKLQTLVQHLVDMEVRKKGELLAEQSDTFAGLENLIMTGTNKLRKGISDAARSELVRSIPIVKGVGAAVSLAVGNEHKAGIVINAIKELRNRNFAGKSLGILASTWNEIEGANDTNTQFHALLRSATNHERTRQGLIESISELVKKGFINNGEDLTVEERSALTRTLLRTDLAVLLDHYNNTQEIIDLVTDPKLLESAIAEWKAQLSGKYKNYYLRQSKDLGYFMATGKVSNTNLMMNAHNIAHLGGTKKVIQGNDATADANAKVIDVLASLYAIKYLPSEIKSTVHPVLLAEQNRGAENGVDVVLKLHKDIQKRAMELNFNNNPMLMVKGYTKDIFDPRRSIQVASVSQAKAEMLEEKGWIKAGKVSKDPADPDQDPKHLYYLPVGLAPHVTGALSYTNRLSRGSAVTGLTYRTSENAGQRADIARRVDALFNTPESYNPSKYTVNHMVPRLDTSGNVMEYRYMMNEDTKDTVLNRNNRIEDIMGAMEGNVYDKHITPEANDQVIEALYKQYSEEYENDPNAYVEVSVLSPEKEIRENYKLLPEATKETIRRLFGKDRMMVRADVYDMLFGYRKYSLAQVFDTQNEHRNILEKIFAKIMEILFGEKAALRVRQGENHWQTLVTWTKDNVVIKNVFTLLGNISSNLTLLLWWGVPPGKIIQYHTESIEGLVTHSQHQRELTQLEHMKQSGVLQGKTAQELDQRIQELKDEMDRNPIKELIDAGIFQTIATDVDTAEDAFEYDSRMAEWLTEKTEWVPDRLKAAGKIILMTHDTPLYKLLYQSTTMSDFVARYTLHQHLTTRKKNPIPKDKSIQLIVDSFVNYDNPSHKAIQYANDMGLLWFTKFFLRIQKVIMHLAKEEPARAIGILLLGRFLDSIPNITESSFIGHIGNNPLGSGAFEYPDSIDEIATINAMLTPLGM